MVAKGSNASRSGPFDVVLLDLNLPVYLRRRGLPPDQALASRQPVIICSAAILDGHMRRSGVAGSPTSSSPNPTIPRSS